MSDMLFNGWPTLGRTVLVGGMAYIALVLMLRVSGKRTLAKMNSFDWVVTVALGSTLATVLLTKDVALAEGLTAFALLIVLQFVVTSLSVRTEFVRGLARSEPRLLFYQGEFLEDAMRAERVTHSEVLQAIRSGSALMLEEVAGVVIETDGTFSVVKRSDGGGRTSLAEVRRDDTQV
jgi:uncharacterized membrane protein YcaP (DUF421 family)